MADSTMSNPTRTFPGVEQTPGLTYGPLRERGSLDGVLIRVGGKDDTVPVHLLDGDKVHVCNANREVARRLAPDLFGSILRVHGEGRWERDQEGKWNLLRFDIRDFEPLDDVPLGEAVRRLRAVKGAAGSESRNRLASFIGSAEGRARTTEWRFSIAATLLHFLDPDAQAAMGPCWRTDSRQAR